MASAIPTPPFTEPLIVTAQYCSGVVLDVQPNIIELVFWSHTASMSDNPEERRITARIAIPIEAARIFCRDLSAALRNGTH